MKFEVNVFVTYSGQIESGGLKELAVRLWEKESGPDAALNIILTDENHLLQLNRQFKNKEYDTDILSFPLSDAESDLFEGEVYISVDRVLENAKLFSVAASEELRRMVAHGLLHFLGYDDATPAARARMVEKENHYLVWGRDSRT